MVDEEKENDVGVRGLDNLQDPPKAEPVELGDFADAPKDATPTPGDKVIAKDPASDFKMDEASNKTHAHQVVEDPEEHIGDAVPDPWEKHEGHFEVDAPDPGAKPIDSDETSEEN